MRLLFTFLLTALSSVAFAQNSIAIHQKDGNVATFAFSEKPVVTYSGNDLVLTTKQTTVTYPVYMLQKIVFDLKDIVDDVDALEVEGKSEFSFQGETLNISGGEPGSSVFIYNMSGMMVGQYRLDSNGHASIPISGMDKSLYIVKTTRFTFKFRKS